MLAERTKGFGPCGQGDFDLIESTGLDVVTKAPSVLENGLDHGSEILGCVVHAEIDRLETSSRLSSSVVPDVVSE